MIKNCPQKPGEGSVGVHHQPSGSSRPTTAVKQELNKRSKPLKCYNCGEVGHISTQCPSKALFCRDGDNHGAARRTGLVEGHEVQGILLDTGCSRTMVRKEFVTDEKFLEGEAVTVCCAHGDTVLYPLAEVEMEVDGVIDTITFGNRIGNGNFRVITPCCIR